MRVGKLTAWWIRPGGEPNTANVTATPSTSARIRVSLSSYVVAECSSVYVTLWLEERARTCIYDIDIQRQREGDVVFSTEFI